MLRRLLTGVVTSALFALLTVWVGFRWPVEVPGPRPELSVLTNTTVLYDGLPRPLQYYLRQTVSRTPPVATTGVFWGTAQKRFRIGPLLLWLPVRWTSVVDLDVGAAWTGQVMWFGRPLTELHEWVSADETCPFLSQQGMGFSALEVWLPSSLVARPPGSWATIDRWTTRLAAPNAEEMILKFDPRTRGLSVVLGSGCSQRADDQVAWSVRFVEWGSPGRMTIPVAGHSIVNGTQHYRFRIKGAVFNRNVARWTIDSAPLPDVDAMLATLAAMDSPRTFSSPSGE